MVHTLGALFSASLGVVFWTRDAPAFGGVSTGPGNPALVGFCEYKVTEWGGRTMLSSDCSFFHFFGLFLDPPKIPNLGWKGLPT